MPSFSPPGLAWVLEKNTDLVLQLHLHPSGKPEQVQPRIGFYFTDTAPTNVAYRIRLESFKIDIPPGASDYRVEQSYVLPVDVTLLRILPHAHYLGKEMRVVATLPDGTRKWRSMFEIEILTGRVTTRTKRQSRCRRARH